METIGNIEEITNAVSQFYPDRVLKAVDYIMDTYAIGINHATHITSIAWSKLNFKYPWNLPYYLIMPHNIFVN